MSLDQLGPREPKMQFFWISFSRTVCDVAKLGHGKNCCRDPWRTICAFFITPFATLKPHWTPNGVTVCYYSSGVEVESLAHPANTLAGEEEKRHNISYPLRHTQTHTHLVEEEWNVGSAEGWNVTVRFLSIPGSDICLGRLSRGGAVLLCTV